MTLGLLHDSYSLPKGQAVKLTFFALKICVNLSHVNFC